MAAHDWIERYGRSLGYAALYVLRGVVRGRSAIPTQLSKTALSAGRPCSFASVERSAVFTVVRPLRTRVCRESRPAVVLTIVCECSPEVQSEYWVQVSSMS